jgi:lysophospholipase L1-like esterase
MAVWDMYNITGGYGSRAKWKKYYLIAGDGVHFSKAGYNMQGRMFLQALLNAYDDYKKARKD